MALEKALGFQALPVPHSLPNAWLQLLLESSGGKWGNVLEAGKCQWHAKGFTAPIPIRSALGCHCGQGTAARSRTVRLIAVQSRHMVAIRSRAVLLEWQKKPKNVKIMHLCFKSFSDWGPKETGEIHSSEKLPVKCVCVCLCFSPSDYENFQLVCESAVSLFCEITWQLKTWLSILAVRRQNPC